MTWRWVKPEMGPEKLGNWCWEHRGTISWVKIIQEYSGTLNVVYLFIVRPRGTADWGMGLVCGPAGPTSQKNMQPTTAFCCLNHVNSPVFWMSDRWSEQTTIRWGIPFSDQFWIFHFQDGSSMMFPSYFPGLQRWGSNVSLRFQPRFSWTQLQADWTRPYAKRSPQYDGCLIWSVGGLSQQICYDSIAVAYFTFWFTVIIVVICPDVYIIICI